MVHCVLQKTFENEDVIQLTQNLRVLCLKIFWDILAGEKISMAMVERVWEELLKLGGWGDTWLPWGRPHTAYHNLQ